MSRLVSEKIFEILNLKFQSCILSAAADPRGFGVNAKNVNFKFEEKRAMRRGAPVTE